MCNGSVKNYTGDTKPHFTCKEALKAQQQQQQQKSLCLKFQREGGEWSRKTFFWCKKNWSKNDQMYDMTLFSVAAAAAAYYICGYHCFSFYIYYVCLF